MKYLWMAVTPDEYEFPIYIEDTAEKLGNKLGIKTSTVVASISRKKPGTSAGRKLVKVPLD